jgi:hypothetical protein
MTYIHRAEDLGTAVAGAMLLAAYIWGSLFGPIVIRDLMKPNPEKYHGIHRAKGN